MTMEQGRKSFTVLIFVLGFCLTAAAAARKPGDTLVYEIVEQSQVGGGHLPAAAYTPRPATSRTVKMIVTSVEPDANAMVHVDFNTPVPASAAALARPSQLAAFRAEWEAQNRYKQVDARLTRDGVLLVAVDNSQQDDPNLNGKSLPQVRDAAVAEVHSPAYQAKLAANEAAGLFGLPNAVVLSCAKRASLADGDVWRVLSKSDGAAYDVMVKGRQSYRGHNVVVLNAKLRSDYPSGSTNVDATVYYDLQVGLVVGTHTVTISTIQATGMTSTSTADFNLKE
jgi:hypothetical protein